MNFDIGERVSTEILGKYGVLLRGDEIAILPSTSNTSPTQSCLIPSDTLSTFQTSDPILVIGHYKSEVVSLVVSDEDTPSALFDSLPCEFISLRGFLSSADEQQTLIASRAAQLAAWRRNHRYCSACGSRVKLSLSERAYACDRCGYHMYPKMSPCVIGVVVHGNELLLANGRSHKESFYSAIAGFIEVGETPEQAFVREVKEEVGVDIEDVQYIESQTWPFPSQMMLGFVARYKAGNIKIEPKEIVDAAWFHKDSLPNLPAGFTISAKLIRYAISQMEQGL